MPKTPGKLNHLFRSSSSLGTAPLIMSVAETRRPAPFDRRSEDQMSTDSAHRYSDVSQACPIVFVHGSLSSRRIWTPYSAEFGTRETIAVDLPGYGDEPAWPESALYRLTDAAVTIQSAIEARREQADLVAHSFGAAVARVRSLTLVEPTWFGIL